MDNQQPSIDNGVFYQKPKKGYGYIYRYISPSGKSYIGQTINSLKVRAVNLISGNGYKKCSLFWKAIQKYGWPNFQVEILEETEIENLNEQEIYYIAKYNSLAPNGYNLTKGGEKGKEREVYVYSAQTGELLEHYSSLTEASKETGIPIETISAIISEKSIRKQSHNLVFLDYCIDKYDINNLARKNYHKVYSYDKDGFYLAEFISVREAARFYGLTDGQIRKCLNGSTFHAKYIQFKDEKFDKITPIPKNSKTPISVIQIDPITSEEIAIFPSLAAAAKSVGLNSGEGIKKVISRGKGLSGGYFWKINEGPTTKYEQNPGSSVRDSLKKDEDIV